MSDQEGKIQTVLGCLQPEDAGFTLAHEHLLCNFHYLVKDMPSTNFPEYSNRPLASDFGWWVTHYPYSSYDNNHLHEETEAVREELAFFKKNGGGTIVDNTTYGIGPDPRKLADLSASTGVHLVAGAGYYLEPSRPGTEHMSQEEFASVMRKEITEGCDNTDIKAGVIGEVGCSWPMTTSERFVLRASAEVECDIGCPVIIHPGWNERAPAEIMRIYQEAGGHAERVVMSHMDRTFFDLESLLDFASTGCYVEYDHFGLEVSYYQLHEETDMPSDATRIQFIKSLVQEGYQDRITVGHDIHTKHALMKYGGHGFSHILLQVVPRMLLRGISQENVDKIMKHNPQRWLTFTKHKN